MELTVAGRQMPSRCPIRYTSDSVSRFPGFLNSADLLDMTAMGKI